MIDLILNISFVYALTQRSQNQSYSCRFDLFWNGFFYWSSARPSFPDYIEDKKVGEVSLMPIVNVPALSKMTTGDLKTRIGNAKNLKGFIQFG